MSPNGPVTNRFLSETHFRIELPATLTKHSSATCSNRNSVDVFSLSPALRFGTVRFCCEGRESMLRCTLISPADPPKISNRRMTVVHDKGNFSEPSEPCWASLFFGGRPAARRCND